MVDIAVFCIVGISVLIALMRGFVREVLSLTGMIVSAGLAYVFYSQAGEYLQTQGLKPMTANIAGGIGIFVILSIIFAIVNTIAARFVRNSSFKGIDTSLGVLFGFLRGYFLVALSFVIVSELVDEDHYPKFLKEAKTLNALKFGSDAIKSAWPEESKEITRLSKDALETLEENKAEDEKNDEHKREEIKQEVRKK